MINMIYWLLHWQPMPKCFYFLHLSSYINSRSVSLSEYDKSRTLFSDVERKSAWHNRLIKWITPRIAKRCVADVAFSHDKRHVVGFTGASSSMHLDKTGRILVQYSSFSGSFRARSRVTPFSVSKKRRGLRVAALKSPPCSIRWRFPQLIDRLWSCHTSLESSRNERLYTSIMFTK